VPGSASNETTALLPAVIPTYGAVGTMSQSNPAVDMVRERRPHRGGGRSDTRCLGTFPEDDQRYFRWHLSNGLWGCRDHPTKSKVGIEFAGLYSATQISPDGVRCQYAYQESTGSDTYWISPHQDFKIISNKASKALKKALEFRSILKGAGQVAQHSCCTHEAHRSMQSWS
jgi:hypothetical protein